MRLERWGGLAVGLSEEIDSCRFYEEVCIGVMVARNKLV